MRSLSLVIPVYNEEQALPHTCARLRRVAEQLHSQAGLREIEFIFVNDGSRDQTARLLQQEQKLFQSPHSRATVISFSRNFGHSAAVFAGLERAEGDLVGIIDADLQDPPELLVEMVRTMDREQADVVYGQRLRRQGEGVFKRVTAWGFYRLLDSLSGVEIPRDTGDFRLMTREVSDQVRALPEGEPFLRGLVAWVGFKQVAFPYERQAREYGVTKYPLRKMMAFAGHAIMSFSLLPLRLAMYLGVFGFLFSVAYAGYAVYRFFTGEVVPGWASLVVVFTMGQSITLVMVGILGYYLGRIHMSQQQRPRYIVRRSPPSS